MCNFHTSTYSLCTHKGPTTITSRCPGYIDSGFEITCDDPLKRKFHPRVLDGYCLGCRPVVHEDGDSEVEEVERRKERMSEERSRKRRRIEEEVERAVDEDEEMEWRLLEALEKQEGEERRAVGGKVRGGKRAE